MEIRVRKAPPPYAAPAMMDVRIYRNGKTPEQRSKPEELERMNRQASASGYFYHGASQTKNSMIGWITGGGSAEDDIDLQSSLLRIRSRDLYAGGGLGRSAPATMVTNVVGWGIRPKSKINYKLLGLSEKAALEWQATAQREFELWAKTEMCDAARHNNFWEMQELAFRSMLVSGDVFALFGSKNNLRNPYSMVIRLIEADRVCNEDSDGESEATNMDNGNRVVDGIEIDKNGEVCRYHIVNYHPLSDETQGDREWTTIEAFGKDTGLPNILHLMTDERPEQHRGIPFVAAMIEQIKQLDRYLNSELAASIVAAMLTVFITSDAPDDGDTAANDGIAADQKVTDDKMKIEMGSGNIYELPPHKKPESIGNVRAPSAFDAFVSRLTTFIGCSVEIPPEVLMHQYGHNYTASRAAALDFWKVVSRYRQRFVEKFCQPIYEQFLAEAVSLGRLEAPGFFDDVAIREAWCGCRWIGTSQGHVQPVQEANAARIRMETGISTGEQEAMQYDGSDYFENIAQRRRELAAAAMGPEGEKENGK